MAFVPSLFFPFSPFSLFSPSPPPLVPPEAAATQVGAMVAAKVPYMHGTVLVPEYPVATHVNVQSAPLATSEAEQSVVYASFPVPPAAMLPVHGAGTASQQTAAVVPVTPDPLFWVLA